MLQSSSSLPGSVTFHSAAPQRVCRHRVRPSEVYRLFQRRHPLSWGATLSQIHIAYHKTAAHLRVHLVQPPRDTANEIRVLRALSNLVLNVSRDGASTTSLGNPFQCFTTLIVKNFFLLSSPNLPCFSLKPSPLVLSLLSLLKRLSPSFPSAPFKHWKAAIRSPRSLLFSRLNKPNSLSLSSQERCSSPQTTFVALN